MFRFIERPLNLALRHPTVPASLVFRLLPFSSVEISIDFRLIVPSSIAIAFFVSISCLVSFVFRLYFSLVILPDYFTIVMFLSNKLPPFPPSWPFDLS
jgi:hypothetical protein